MRNTSILKRRKLIGIIGEKKVESVVENEIKIGAGCSERKN
jgi:hypothetical protein